MCIRLSRKLALTMNGIDVSRLQVGDIIELPPDQAEMRSCVVGPNGWTG